MAVQVLRLAHAFFVKTDPLLSCHAAPIAYDTWAWVQDKCPAVAYGGSCGYKTQAECEADARLQVKPVTITHKGGPLAVQLIDYPASDNIQGNPSTTWDIFPSSSW